MNDEIDNESEWMKDDEIHWWNDPQNKEIINFPIAIVHEGEWWVASTNDETKKLLGVHLTGCSQGKTKEEAIEKLFDMIRFTHEYADECRLNYQRWVPLRSGNWRHIGGTWIAVFGLHFYFRYGENMKHGFYIPLTKLNILFSSDWIHYKQWKKNEKTLNKETED